MPEPQQQPSVGTGLPPGFAREPGATNAVPSSEVIRNMAKDYGLNPDITERQIHQESRGNPAAVSPKGAIGLMQLMPPVAEKWGVDPHNPSDNLHAGMSEMRELLDRFHGDYPKALAAYNAGAHTVDKYGGIPPYKETQDYVDNIMGDEGVQHVAQPSLPAGFTTAPGEAPTPVSSPTVASPPTDDTGVLASLKRNTVGAAKGMYHAFADDATPEELAHFKELGQRIGAPPETYNNPSTASLAWHRLFEHPSDELSEKGSAQIAKGGVNNVLSGATNKALAYVPMLGPFVNSIAERAEKGDVSGAATDIASAWALEHAPALMKKGASAVSKSWDLAHAAGLMDQTVKDFTAAVPPTKSNPYTPADYRAARVHLENEHTGAPITSVEGLRDAADTAIGKIEDHIADRIAQAPDDKITTYPSSDVMAALSKYPRGASFALAGLKELEDFGLEEPKTVAEADAIRRQLNAENKAVLKRNNYDQATARAADPGFAAREVAAESIRNGLYDALKQRGTPGLDALRQEEGSLIKVRNAAQGQMFNGDKVVGSSTVPSTAQRVGQGAVRVGSRLAGAEVAGWPGYIVGREVGDVAANAIGPKPMTRNALVDRAFKVKTSDFMGYPKGRVQQLPPTQVPAGTQLPLQPQPPGPPTTVNPQQQGLFNEPITENAEQHPIAWSKGRLADVNRVVQEHANVLRDPNATSSQKATARGFLDKLTDRLKKPFVKNTQAGVFKIGNAPESAVNEEPIKLPDHDTLVDAMVEKGLDPRHAETRTGELLAAAGGKKGYTNIEQKVAPQLIRHYMGASPASKTSSILPAYAPDEFQAEIKKIPEAHLNELKVKFDGDGGSYYSRGTIHTDEQLPEQLVHEVGHHAHAKLNATANNEWKKIVQEEPPFVGESDDNEGEKVGGEHFAEAYQRYADNLSSAELKKHPAAHDFMKRLFTKPDTMLRGKQ